MHDDFLRRTDLHHTAVAHDRDAVADADGLVEIVRDEDGGFLEDLGEAQELVLKLAADERVERAEKARPSAVHVRVGGKGPRQPDALLHPARKLMRELVAPGAKLDDVEDARGLPEAGRSC